MIRNMVSIVRVWLVLSLNLVLWLYLIVDYWFNFLSGFNGLFYYNIKFLMFFVWSFLFYFKLLLTSSLFSNQWLLIDVWFFSLSTIYYFVFVFFYTMSLSLSLSLSIGNLSFSKIWWWFYDIKYALLIFFFNLVFLTWFVLYFILPLMHWVWEWVFP